MPMTPHKGESQSDFMDRCMSDMTDEHDKDQAVAICMDIWQGRSSPGIERREAVEARAGFEYVLSDATPDRHGTVIDPSGWDLDTFRKNNIAFFNHNSDFPIGTWEKVRVEGNKLIGKLKLAEEGTSARIDEIIRLVRQGILKAVSVGFRPLAAPELVKEIPHYKKVQLLEASVVGVGSNPNALVLARAMGTSAETLKTVFGEQAAKAPSEKPSGISGKKAESSVSRKSLEMNVSQQIEAARAELVSLRDELSAHLTDNGDSPDDVAMTATEEYNRKIAAKQRQLDTLEESEKLMAARAVPVATPEAPRNGEVIPPAPRPFARAAPPEVRPGEHFMRALVATVIARAKGWRPGLDTPEPFFRALAERYGQDGKLDERTAAIGQVVCRAESEAMIPTEVCQRGLAPMLQRAATAPATTTTSGWASQLVNIGYADFLNLLLPQSVFPGLAARSMRLTFGRNGTISIPSRVSTPTVAGSFVAEGSPIPVRQAAVTSTTFTPKKMGVISSFTREIAEHSTPAIETLLRQWMQEDTSVALDSILLDTTAASATRPAGIRNGVAGLTATAGGGFAALIGDIKQLTGALLTATNNNLRNPVWLMNPAQQLSIALTQNAGGEFPFAAEINRQQFTNYPVVVSGNVPSGVVIVLDAADFAVIEAGAPRFDVSDQAVLVYDDTAPAALGTSGTPNAVGAPARSLWQTDSLAIRMILDVNWGFVRSGAIAWTSGVTW